MPAAADVIAAREGDDAATMWRRETNRAASGTQTRKRVNAGESPDCGAGRARARANTKPRPKYRVCEARAFHDLDTAALRGNKSDGSRRVELEAEFGKTALAKIVYRQRVATIPCTSRPLKT